MKKTFSVILCLILLLYQSAIPAFAEKTGIIAAVTGMSDLSGAVFTLKLKNTNAKAENVKVYLARYYLNGELEKVIQDTVTVGGGASEVKSYEIDITFKTAKIYVWDSRQRPIIPAMSSKECQIASDVNRTEIEINPADVWATAEPEADNPASNAADGDINTVWTANGFENEHTESLTLYLHDEYYINEIALAFGLGNEREYIFSVDASLDGEQFEEILPRTTSEKTVSMQSYLFGCVKARLIRVNIHGRTDKKDWIRLAELKLFGSRAYSLSDADSFASLSRWTVNPMSEMTYTDYTPTLGSQLYAEACGGVMKLYDSIDRGGGTDGKKLTVKSAYASQTPESANGAGNVLDGKLDTKWTASNVSDSNPATLTLELDGTYHITKTALAFGVGNERVYTFSVDASLDGKNYTTVTQKRSSAKTTALQEFEFMQTEAKYIRFTFYSRTDSGNNGWIQVTEAQIYGTENGIDGAGGVMAQKTFIPPSNKADYKLSFKMNIPSQINGETSNPYYAGISLIDRIVTGGADLSGYAAVQLRFEKSGGKVAVKKMRSNYFNEGSPEPLFENTFAFDRSWDVNIHVMPQKRMADITISDGTVKETQALSFAHNDLELTRPSRWTGLTVNTIVFNTGAGSKCEMNISDFEIHENSLNNALSDCGLNGPVRLEATRLKSDPASSGDYFGRYVYHSGENSLLGVKADVNPANTRFVEREGLIGIGVSFEAVSLPGYFLTAENGGIYLKKLERSGSFYAKATFIKNQEENQGYYTGSTCSYSTYLNREKYMYDTTSDRKNGDLKPWSVYRKPNSVFYVRSEAANYVSDNFYGNKISSQWWTNYPWKDNNPTNDSYNFSALISKNNVIVENGELLLKATKQLWVKDMKGKDKWYNNEYGKYGTYPYQGYVGVVSIQNKVYNRQCYIEGSFKQPESPIGYWNAFWLAGRDSWPPEIDIFEFLSSVYGHKTWHTAIHGEGDKNNLFGKSSKDNINLTTGYHTFALDWGYDYVKFYIDGKLFQRGSNNDTINFQKNLRLILNTGVGGWEAEPDDTMIWNDGLRCKYVRSYQY